MSPTAAPADEPTLVYLRALGHRYPNVDAALAEIANLRAVLTLPRGTVHVVSDVHGEDKKLKHIINNASGSLRPLVAEVFGERLAPGEQVALLNLLYYPRETWARVAPEDPAARRAFVRRAVRLELEVLRALVRRYSLKVAEKAFPPDLPRVFRELVFAPQLARDEAYVDALIDPFVDHDRGLDLLRKVAHAVRGLTVAELIVAGDLGDRGPRTDRVIDYLLRQPEVTITWGNHDASWMGACLGHEALIATVVRIAVRYRRLAQLEEGYGIPMVALEALARSVYGDDPAERFGVKGEGLRDPQLMARMQKAVAVLQFKLEGQASARHPEWSLEHRQLLHRIDHGAGTVTIDGRAHPLRDTRLPTIDPADPYALSPDEADCIAHLKRAFLESQVLWEHMSFVARRGRAWLVRDHHLIFHGCVPVDDAGRFLPLALDGAEYTGRALFDALHGVVLRAFRDRRQDDLDLLWYLWTGARSPMFGKDRMATFETYLVADPATHHETKNPYFRLVHEPAFCATVLREFGCDPERGLIVNGHVPVRPDRGEGPLKRSGRAVTIDGAFSEAYGDRGYTLVLDAARTYLAEHHHFESVDEAITRGADIIPTIQDVRVFDRPRTVGDTETGDALRHEIAVLEALIRAYEQNVLPQSSGG